MTDSVESSFEYNGIVDCRSTTIPTRTCEYKHSSVYRIRRTVSIMENKGKYIYNYVPTHNFQNMFVCMHFPVCVCIDCLSSLLVVRLLLVGDCRVLAVRCRSSIVGVDGRI